MNCITVIATGEAALSAGRCGTSVELVDNIGRSLILDALERAGWVKTAAAKLLGINVKLLDYRIEKYGLARA